MEFFFFVTGSAVGYATPAIVALWKKVGMEAVQAWRCAFLGYILIGIVLLLIPAFTIREKDYVTSVIPGISLKESLKHAFSNPYFRIVTLGQLLENTGMAFFQACIMYYVLCDNINGASGNFFGTDIGDFYCRLVSIIPGCE